jgi:hypothetical protein
MIAWAKISPSSLYIGCKVNGFTLKSVQDSMAFFEDDKGNCFLCPLEKAKLYTKRFSKDVK